jgi:hypothetical protein
LDGDCVEGLARDGGSIGGESNGGEGKKRSPASRPPHAAAILFEADRFLFDPDDDQVFVMAGLTIQKREDIHSRVVDSFFFQYLSCMTAKSVTRQLQYQY